MRHIVEIVVGFEGIGVIMALVVVVSARPALIGSIDFIGLVIVMVGGFAFKWLL